MNSKECPKCGNCSPDNAASCRICGAEFARLRPITSDDMTAESDRNYAMGRKHAREELAPAIEALRRLYDSCANIRLRATSSCPQLKSFSDWEENTKAMCFAENTLKNL